MRESAGKTTFTLTRSPNRVKVSALPRRQQALPARPAHPPDHQQALAALGHTLHDPDLSQAILDRLLDRGQLITLRGRSCRTAISTRWRGRLSGPRITH